MFRLAKSAVKVPAGVAKNDTLGLPPEPNRPWRRRDDIVSGETLIRDRTGEIEFPEPSQDDVTPETIGRYSRNLREVGRGGIGRVVVTYDRHLGREVAVKELLDLTESSTSDGRSLDDEERFLREARITGRLEHPSIVPVHEVGRRIDGTLYYTMRFVRGRTLRLAIAQSETLAGRLKLLDHFIDLAQAVAYAHSRGVVHRDIKPDNIMLGQFGETIVLDWGLAKVRGRPDPTQDSFGRSLRRLATGETEAGQVMGTPAYMSPEQAEGQVDQIDERSDVWSLGAVLFELLTGIAPFTGRSVEQTLSAVARGEVPSPEAHEPRVPRDLAAIAKKAMSRSPQDRYANASLLVDDVRAFQSGRLVGAYRYTLLELLRKFVVEHRKTALAVASVAVSILLGTAGTVAAYRNAVLERGRARTAEQAALDARRAAEASEREANANLAMALAEKSQLLTKAKNYGAAGVYAASAAAHSPFLETSPYVDPDLATLDRHDVAKARLPISSALFEALTHRRIELSTHLETTAETCGVAVADDNRTLVASDRTGAITVWDLHRHTPIRTLEGEACAAELHLFPGAERAIYRTRSLEAFLVDLHTGEHKRLTGREIDVRRVALTPDARSIVIVGKSTEVARLNSESLLQERAIRLEEPRSLAISADGARIAVGTMKGQVALIEARRFGIERTFETHPGVWALAFSPDGRALAMSGYTGEVEVREVRGPGRVVLPGSKPTYRLAFTPDGRKLLSAGLEYGRLLNLRSRELEQTFRIHPRGVAFLRFAPSGRFFVTSGFGPGIYLWQIVPSEVKTLSGHGGPISSVAAAPDGRRLVSMADETLRFWDLEQGTLLASASEPLGWSLTHLENPFRIFSINGRGRVREWSEDGQPIRTLQAPLPSRRGSQPGLASSPIRKLLAWTGAGPEVVLHDVSRNKPLARLSELESQSAAVAFSPSGSLLAGSDSGGDIVVWAVDGRARLWSRRKTHNGLVVSGLAFSPDETLLASSGRDGFIRLWSSRAGTLVAEWKAHDDWVNRVAFSPDGTLLVSSSDDQRVRLWSVQDQLPLLELRTPSQALAVGFLPGDERFVVGRGSSLEILPTRLAAAHLPSITLLENAERAAGLDIHGFEVIPKAAPEGGERQRGPP